MIRIEFSTLIYAPRERCFDLSRSIDLHIASTDGTRERAVRGVTSGLIGLNEEVTWKASHFGLPLWHTSRVTAFDRPHYFQDCMVRGLFRRFCHDHVFEIQNSATMMKDCMEFEAPFGFVGRTLERLILRRHMVSLLTHRNAFIKQAAETDKWKQYLRAE
jgi:ligand-binding SRPBCC domain-containing protein